MTYSLRGATADPANATGVVNEYQPDEGVTVPETTNPLMDTSTGSLKFAFWAVVAIIAWKWMKKGTSKTSSGSKGMKYSDLPPGFNQVKADRAYGKKMRLERERLFGR
jgi:hypothetical protein